MLWDWEGGAETRHLGVMKVFYVARLWAKSTTNIHSIARRCDANATCNMSSMDAADCLLEMFCPNAMPRGLILCRAALVVVKGRTRRLRYL